MNDNQLVIDKIKDAKEKQRIEDIKWEEELRKHETESQRFEREEELRKHEAESRSQAAEGWLSKCSEASAGDYAKWLKGYLAQGGEITHVYDYEMPAKFGVANQPITMTKLCGGDSVSIIADNVAVEVESMGHNQLYVIDGDEFKVIPKGMVPLYSDVEKLLVPDPPDEQTKIAIA